MFPLHQTFFGQEARHAIGRLRPLGEPLLNPVELQGYAGRIVLLKQGVVRAHLFNEATVAGRMAVGHHDGIIGALLGAATGKANFQHG